MLVKNFAPFLEKKIKTRISSKDKNSTVCWIYIACIYRHAFVTRVCLHTPYIHTLYTLYTTLVCMRTLYTSHTLYTKRVCMRTLCTSHAYTPYTRQTHPIHDRHTRRPGEKCEATRFRTSARASRNTAALPPVYTQRYIHMQGVCVCTYITCLYDMFMRFKCDCV